MRTSSRTFVGSMLCGRIECVDIIIKNGAESNYYINGFKRLSTEGEVFVCVAALASLPTDSVLRSLKGNRVVKVHAELRQRAVSEMEKLTLLSRYTWSQIGGVCGLSGSELRTRILRAAHVSIGFLDHRVFLELQQLPWSLMCGDLDNKLDAFMQQEQPN